MTLANHERAWFLWDEKTTVGELRLLLASADGSEKARLLGRVLREAPDPVVWELTTVAEVRALFPDLERYLGRRRAFWRYLLTAWERHGLA